MITDSRVEPIRGHKLSILKTVISELIFNTSWNLHFGFVNNKQNNMNVKKMCERKAWII